MRALALATREALKAAGLGGDEVDAIALDTTGSSVVPVDAAIAPARRLLPVVRPPRQGRGGGDHRGRRIGNACRRSTGAAACIPPNGDSRNSSIGCGTIPTSENNSRARSSIATWSRRRCAASPTRARRNAASARWATNGYGTAPSAACRPNPFWSRSTRCWRGCAKSSMATTKPPTRSLDFSRRSGRKNSGCGQESRSRSARSTRTGTRSARGRGRATWSTWSALLHVSSPTRPRRTSCRACAAWCRAACIRSSPASRPACRRPATFLRPSPAVPARPSRISVTDWKNIAPGRPGCCA